MMPNHLHFLKRWTLSRVLVGGLACQASGVGALMVATLATPALAQSSEATSPARLTVPAVVPAVGVTTAQAPTADVSGPRLVDRVVAIVNREAITLSELVRRENQFLQNLRRQGVEPPNPKVLREQVLERMINDRAMLHVARENGVRVDDATLDRSIARIAEQNGLSINGLRNQLENEGIAFSTFRQNIREEIILTRLREREVDGRVQISENEVDTFLASQGQSIQRVQEFRVSQILVRLPENATPEESALAKEKLQRVETALKSGQAFGSVAKELSDAPDKEQGGDLGWRERGRLPSLFLTAVESLKPGEVSRVVRSPNGFHILRLDDQRSILKTQEVTVHRARHILIKVDAQTSEEAAFRRINDLRGRIDGGIDFAQIAKEFSQDPGSAARGGELDWAFPGDLVPEFERAMAQLQVNQISDPVRSVFGFHLIQLLERKREPLTEDRLRTAARMAVREQKLLEAIAEWTREIRATAYIEIKRDEL